MKPGSLIRKIRRSPISPNYDADKATDLSVDFTTSTCSSASFSECNYSEDESFWGEDDDYNRRVRFCTKEDSRLIPNCKYMDPFERENTWYLRDELSAMKSDARKLASGIKIAKKELVSKLKNCYHQAKFIAESGIDEDELITVGNGVIVADLEVWTSSDFAAEACRGLEKSLLQKEREASIGECRQVVAQAMALYGGEEDCADAVATSYREITRHSGILAHSVAKADAAAF